VNARDEMEAGLEVKLDRPIFGRRWWYARRRRSRVGMGGRGFKRFVRRAIGFVYRDRVEEFEGLGVREVVLA
jgi:hypothetical protein